jgi:hypothetical protein
MQYAILDDSTIASGFSSWVLTPSPIATVNSERSRLLSQRLALTGHRQCARDHPQCGSGQSRCGVLLQEIAMFDAYGNPTPTRSWNVKQRAKLLRFGASTASKTDYPVCRQRFRLAQRPWRSHHQCWISPPDYGITGSLATDTCHPPSPR